MPSNEPEYIPLAQQDSFLPLPPIDHARASGSTSSSRRSSLNSLGSLKGRRWRSRQYAIVLVTALIGLGIFMGHPAGMELAAGRLGKTTSGSREDEAGQGYVPGRLGKGLLSRRRATLGSSSTTNWEEILDPGVTSSSSSASTGGLFDLLAGRDEELCEGYVEGAEDEYTEKGCWRARMVKQVDGWGYEDAE